MTKLNSTDVTRTSTHGRPWFLLRTKPGGILRAENNLLKQGVDPFMPRYRVTTRGSGSILKPLFSGYLFASFHPDDVPFRTINSTFGVSCLVTNGYNLNDGLPQALIEGLKSRCDENGILCPPKDLAPDENIRILSGPFADFIASVEELSSSNRVKVLFQLMGQTVHATLPIADVERISDDQYTLNV